MTNLELRVLVCGSRSWTDIGVIRDILKGFPEDTIVLHGGALGADTLADQVAREYGYQVEQFPAQWQVYGRRAGILRNNVMLGMADKVIAFWDGHSTGTKHVITSAKKRGLSLLVITKPILELVYGKHPWL